MPKINVELPRSPGKIEVLEMQTYWDRFFHSSAYRDSLKERIQQGKAAHMEILLHHLVYGKPKENIALQNIGDGNITLIIGGETKVSLTMGADGMVKRQIIEAEPQAALPAAPVEATA